MNTLVAKLLIYIVLIILIYIDHLPGKTISYILLPNFFLQYILVSELLKINNNTFVIIFLSFLEDFITSSILGITLLQFFMLATLIRKNYNALTNQKFLVVWITAFFCITMSYIIKYTVMFAFRESVFHYKIMKEIAINTLFFPLVYSFFHTIYLKINEKPNVR